MTHLYLIRHGQSTWNAEGRMQGWADPPLDEVGRQQAAALAERLRAVALDAIYSSPLLRARETAEAVAVLHGRPVELDDRLKERHLGEWTGLTGDEVEARFPNRRSSDDWRIGGPPGGEGQAQLVARAAAALAEITAAHREGTVVVMSHGGTLNAYLAHALGIPMERRVYFGFENAAIARLRVTDESVALLAAGDRQHLEAMRSE